ncbi:MAG: Demethylmenaquinone methyltransferase [Candidatus Roizmanbacteria bacterium GW2011_GWC2_41_7]|uniref:Demethylmenaquinone methyltransferase n=2 Tax=Patescibacteria group TaxID=1783273 RepID=A0A0G1AAH9_9BACT|nr:MAG: Demethylmenaquinone methyltransferase [Candidatus Roizmanbacteria bacterium GW2011_GWC2_41_7]OGZ19984.1 MAG: hypothetical protein A2654_02090 [Candidatus Nealsonbacteria bacterium RIFCSPHIGHO2_01_FULL_43_31]OGZ24948.1 MAG: hypothetical protein A2922_02460 [Candidatus Nealsonbacteria bacterium RIFCSPLOWO2_01_FULL_43_36]
METLKDYQKRKEKWDKKQESLKVNATRPAMWATFALALQNTLKLLGEKRRGKMLDIGCGFGEIDVLLAQNTNFEIIGFDIAKEAVLIAKANVKKAGLENRVEIKEGDVYNLHYPDNSFDVIVSFGYVSAATFPGRQKEIARILKPGGILVCDFINCLSAYKIFSTTRRVFGGKAPYYLTLEGIRKEFERGGLFVQDQKFLNTFPPLNLRINSKIFLAFEESLGRPFKKILGRVRLVSFKKY